MNVLLCETGILLDKDDPEYDCYNSVYDKQHGFYDEDQYYTSDNLERRKKEVADYVLACVEGTYGIISSTVVDDGFTEKQLKEMPVTQETYLLEDVLYSCKKENGNLVENFLKTK